MIPETCPVDHVINKTQNCEDTSTKYSSDFKNQRPLFELRKHEYFRADLGNDGTLKFRINYDSDNKLVLFGSIYENEITREFGGFFGKRKFPIQIVIGEFIFILEKDNERFNVIIKRSYSGKLDRILYDDKTIIEHINNTVMQTIECERL